MGKNTAYLILSDQREAEATFLKLSAKLDELREESNYVEISIDAYSGPIAHTRRVISEGIEPHLVVNAISEVDWFYRPLVVWRSLDENRWSYTVLRAQP